MPQQTAEGVTGLTAAQAKETVAPNLSLQEKLKLALAKMPGDYSARTKHKGKDGAPEYTNRLLLENSPYLLQHAHNPVNWFPWGKEAFAFSKALRRPIFLSVGYSTCHWCHVMEEESFEDEEVARFINENYIPIKVDREERPDVDSVYMTAVQMLTGRGGWPMSVWLTPELEPFFGGTYFPARDGDRGSRIGFLSLLKRQAAAFSANPTMVLAQAKQLTAKLQRAMTPSEAGGAVGAATLQAAFAQARRRNDERFGGPRGAPKFPSSFPYGLLLRLGWDAKFLGKDSSKVEKQASSMALNGLSKMARGGIYDHAGGGFHRYSVDENWLVPHFEKMLYDNAQLALLYTEAYQLSARAEFKRVATETLDYVAREMTAPDGGFYSATDADSLTPKGHREEGYYFTWTLPELERTLDKQEFVLTSQLYSPTRQGNFEGRNILFLKAPLESYAQTHQLSLEELGGSLERIKQKLRDARNLRPAPLLDDKIQTSWNGLMLAAFARAAAVFGEPSYQTIAEKNAAFFLQAHKLHGRTRHSVRAGQWSEAAFLDDYAFYANGLIELFQTTQKPAYLVAAKLQLDELEKWHSDPASGGYYLNASDQAPLLVREKPDYDKAIPSGNSYALLAQLKMYQLTLDDEYRQRAETTLRAFSIQLNKTPQALSEMLQGVYFQLSVPKQVALALPNKSAGADLQQVLQTEFFPNAVRVVGTDAELAGSVSTVIPWVAGKKAQAGKSTVYVCEQGSCQRPTNNAALLRNQLRGALQP